MNQLIEQEQKSIMQKIEQQERKTRRRTIIYTVIPILFAGILLWVVSNQIIKDKKKLEKQEENLKLLEEITSGWIDDATKAIELNPGAEIYKKNLALLKNSSSTI